MKNTKRLWVLVLVVLWVGLTAFAWFAPNKAVSAAERRPLQQLPEISLKALLNGDFMEKFEGYTLDQFPARDAFRTVKSLFSYYVLQQKDNNGIYIEDGYAAKLEYPLSSPSVSNALKKFQYIYEQYLEETDSKIYMTVIPDKGYYLAEAAGYPAMDYEELFERVSGAMPWATQVDITKDLDISHYYRTDTHWRQETLLPAAQRICLAMDATLPRAEDFVTTVATQQFYGVYYGQAALPMQPETISILESPALEACRVYNHETKEYGSIYDLAKLSGKDPYEVYLSGAQALLTIENPNGNTQRELIVFRDSFGSALAPLLVQGYKIVTLVDIRYVHSGLLEEYLTFRGQDVLFAYSTLILNNSTSLK